ncbi:hypothetical protein HZS_5205, partial [Henneguya salminicola]
MSTQKCLNKQGFICCVTGVGGPFYSSFYNQEFSRGLSLAFRCMHDIFEPKKSYPLLIKSNSRSIQMHEINSLLLVSIGDNVASYIFENSLLPLHPLPLLLRQAIESLVSKMMPK